MHIISRQLISYIFKREVTFLFKKKIVKFKVYNFKKYVI